MRNRPGPLVSLRGNVLRSPLRAGSRHDASVFCGTNQPTDGYVLGWVRKDAQSVFLMTALNELRKAMSGTIIALAVVVAALIVATIMGRPSPLEDDETTWP
jgi:hypothetical protein